MPPPTPPASDLTAAAQADNPTGVWGLGGALYFEGDGRLVLSGCDVSDNAVLGGMGGNGGAIAFYGDGHVALRRCRFHANRVFAATQGGGNGV